MARNTANTRLLMATMASVVVCLSACNAAVITAPGFVDPENPDGTDPEAIFVTEVQPLVAARCAGCHTNAATGPVFLDPADYYTSMLDYPGLVVPGAPTDSVLVTKGTHTGPAWNSDEADAINTWIMAEGERAPVEPTPGDSLESPAITVVEGSLNRISLDTLGLPGASIQFMARRVTQGIHLTDISIRGGGTDVSISRPRFVMYDADGAATLDSDRFSTVQAMRVPSGQTVELASALLLVGVDSATGQVAIQFDSANAL